jgi:hypothetical protein
MGSKRIVRSRVVGYLKESAGELQLDISATLSDKSAMEGMGVYETVFWRAGR